MFSNYPVDSLDVGLPGFSISGIVVTERTVRASRYPAWETTTRAFCIDVRTRTIEDIQTELFASLKQTADVVGARLEVNNAVTWSVESPANDELPNPSCSTLSSYLPVRVEGDCIEAVIVLDNAIRLSGSRLTQQPLPYARHRPRVQELEFSSSASVEQSE